MPSCLGGSRALEFDAIEELRLRIEGFRCEGQPLTFSCEAATGRTLRSIGLRYGLNETPVINCRRAHPAAIRTAEFRQATFDFDYSSCEAAIQTGQRAVTFRVSSATSAMSGSYNCMLVQVNENEVHFITSQAMELSIGKRSRPVLYLLIALCFVHGRLQYSISAAVLR